MEYRNLGNSGLQVSMLGLGTNNIGRQVDSATTVAIVEKCLDMGITFFDCADVYGNRGGSETLLGAALKPHRRDVVLSTKSGGSMGEGPYMGGTSRKYLMSALDASLRRLGTDYIDLYYVHFPDGRTPIEETLRAMDDMVSSGRVRYIGCSNFAGWQLVEALWTSRSNHLAPFICAQNRYNLLERGIETELLPACRKYGVGLVPFYPLASGLLTGKYRAGEPPPEGSRLSLHLPIYNGVLEGAQFDKIAAFEDYAKQRGHTIIELALGWLVSKRIVGSVIIGATRPEQVEENAKSAGWRLSEEEMRELDELTQ